MSDIDNHIAKLRQLFKETLGANNPDSDGLTQDFEHALVLMLNSCYTKLKAYQAALQQQEATIKEHNRFVWLQHATVREQQTAISQKNLKIEWLEALVEMKDAEFKRLMKSTQSKIKSGEMSPEEMLFILQQPNVPRPEDSKLFEIAEKHNNILNKIVNEIETSRKTFESTMNVLDVTKNLISLVDEASQRVIDSSDKAITSLREDLSAYKKGPLERRTKSEEQWAVAQKYLYEEIEKQEQAGKKINLKNARYEAAKRAELTVKERQLNGKLKAPIKKSN